MRKSSSLVANSPGRKNTQTWDALSCKIPKQLCFNQTRRESQKIVHQHHRHCQRMWIPISFSHRRLLQTFKKKCWTGLLLIMTCFTLLRWRIPNSSWSKIIINQPDLLLESNRPMLAIDWRLLPIRRGTWSGTHTTNHSMSPCLRFSVVLGTKRSELKWTGQLSPVVRFERTPK